MLLYLASQNCQSKKFTGAKILFQAIIPSKASSIPTRSDPAGSPVGARLASCKATDNIHFHQAIPAPSAVDSTRFEVSATTPPSSTVPLRPSCKHAKNRFQNEPILTALHRNVCDPSQKTPPPLDSIKGDHFHWPPNSGICMLNTTRHSYLQSMWPDLAQFFQPTVLSLDK